MRQRNADVGMAASRRTRMRCRTGGSRS